MKCKNGPYKNDRDSEKGEDEGNSVVRHASFSKNLKNEALTEAMSGGSGRTERAQDLFHLIEPDPTNSVAAGET